MIEKPYGLWNSPISALQLSQRVRLDDVQWDSDGQTLLWLEGRSDRTVLVARSGADAPRVLTPAHSLRGSAAYGGGEFTVRNGQVIFAERSGQLFRRTLDAGEPRAITPPFGGSASPALSPDGRWVVYVFSDGKEDLLAAVDARGAAWPVQVARGADFYMQPVWHPDGRRIAWVEWDHPNMPWDDTRICAAQLGDPPGRIGEQWVAAEGSGSYLEPQFSPDGRWLSFVAADGEWDRLVLADLQTGQQHTLLQGEGYHLTSPAWVQGVRSYGWTADSRAIYSLRYRAGRVSLWRIGVEDGRSEPVDLGPYTWMKQLAVSPVREELAVIASAPSIPDRLIRWDGQRVTVEARSEAEDVPAGYLPEPVEIEWQAPDRTSVYGLYAAPRNPTYIATGLPPALISIHGGPTSVTPVKYNAEAAYFTSRGYGWLDVNYRGSTGYGRSYQQLLYGRWGLADVEDAAGGAQALVSQELADEDRLVIRGGSAGGYTVLNALARYPGRFKAGVCLYGVSNLYALAMDTHKFEERYNDRLVGPLPQASQQYADWSPVFQAGSIRDPLAVFQGAEDRSVPPSQSEEIVAALRANRVPHLYQLYPREGHGFRKVETIQDYLQKTERFLLEHVLFAP
jgi:dipeptidyl aminopeptidase/acylaminoacyl peptidase